MARQPEPIVLRVVTQTTFAIFAIGELILIAKSLRRAFAELEKAPIGRFFRGLELASQQAAEATIKAELALAAYRKTARGLAAEQGAAAAATTGFASAQKAATAAAVTGLGAQAAAATRSANTVQAFTSSAVSGLGQVRESVLGLVENLKGLRFDDEILSPAVAAAAAARFREVDAAVGSLQGALGILRSNVAGVARSLDDIVSSGALDDLATKASAAAQATLQQSVAERELVSATGSFAAAYANRGRAVEAIQIGLRDNILRLKSLQVQESKITASTPAVEASLADRGRAAAGVAAALGGAEKAAQALQVEEKKLAASPAAPRAFQTRVQGLGGVSRGLGAVAAGVGGVVQAERNLVASPAFGQAAAARVTATGRIQTALQGVVAQLGSLSVAEKEFAASSDIPTGVAAREAALGKYQVALSSAQAQLENLQKTEADFARTAQAQVTVLEGLRNAYGSVADAAADAAAGVVTQEAAFVEAADRVVAAAQARSQALGTYALTARELAFAIEAVNSAEARGGAGTAVVDSLPSSSSRSSLSIDSSPGGALALIPPSGLRGLLPPIPPVEIGQVRGKLPTEFREQFARLKDFGELNTQNALATFRITGALNSARNKTLALLEGLDVAALRSFANNETLRALQKTQSLAAIAIAELVFQLRDVLPSAAQVRAINILAGEIRALSQGITALSPGFVQGATRSIPFGLAASLPPAGSSLPLPEEALRGLLNVNVQAARSVLILTEAVEALGVSSAVASRLLVGLSTDLRDLLTGRVVLGASGVFREAVAAQSLAGLGRFAVTPGPVASLPPADPLALTGQILLILNELRITARGLGPEFAGAVAGVFRRLLAGGGSPLSELPSGESRRLSLAIADVAAAFAELPGVAARASDVLRVLNEDIAALSRGEAFRDVVFGNRPFLLGAGALEPEDFFSDFRDAQQAILATEALSPRLALALVVLADALDDVSQQAELAILATGTLARQLQNIATGAALSERQVALLFERLAIEIGVSAERLQGFLVGSAGAVDALFASADREARLLSAVRSFQVLERDLPRVAALLEEVGRASRISSVGLALFADGVLQLAGEAVLRSQGFFRPALPSGTVAPVGLLPPAVGVPTGLELGLSPSRRNRLLGDLLALGTGGIPSEAFSQGLGNVRRSLGDTPFAQALFAEEILRELDRVFAESLAEVGRVGPRVSSSILNLAGTLSGFVDQLELVLFLSQEVADSLATGRALREIGQRLSLPSLPPAQGGRPLPPLALAAREVALGRLAVELIEARRARLSTLTAQGTFFGPAFPATLTPENVPLSGRQIAGFFPDRGQFLRDLDAIAVRDFAAASASLAQAFGDARREFDRLQVTARLTGRQVSDLVSDALFALNENLGVATRQITDLVAALGFVDAREAQIASLALVRAIERAVVETEQAALAAAIAVERAFSATVLRISGALADLGAVSGVPARFIAQLNADVAALLAKAPLPPPGNIGALPIGLAAAAQSPVPLAPILVGDELAAISRAIVTLGEEAGLTAEQVEQLINQVSQLRFASQAIAAGTTVAEVASRLDGVQAQIARLQREAVNVRDRGERFRLIGEVEALQQAADELEQFRRGLAAQDALVRDTSPLLLPPADTGVRGFLPSAALPVQEVAAALESVGEFGAGLDTVVSQVGSLGESAGDAAGALDSFADVVNAARAALQQSQGEIRPVIPLPVPELQRSPRLLSPAADLVEGAAEVGRAALEGSVIAQTAQILENAAATRAVAEAQERVAAAAVAASAANEAYSRGVAAATAVQSAFSAAGAKTQAALREAGATVASQFPTFQALGASLQSLRVALAGFAAQALTAFQSVFASLPQVFAQSQALFTSLGAGISSALAAAFQRVRGFVSALEVIFASFGTTLSNLFVPFVNSLSGISAVLASVPQRVSAVGQAVLGIGQALAGFGARIGDAFSAAGAFLRGFFDTLVPQVRQSVAALGSLVAAVGENVRAIGAFVGAKVAAAAAIAQETAATALNTVATNLNLTARINQTAATIAGADIVRQFELGVVAAATVQEAFAAVISVSSVALQKFFSAVAAGVASAFPTFLKVLQGLALLLGGLIQSLGQVAGALLGFGQAIGALAAQAGKGLALLGSLFEGFLLGLTGIATKTTAVNVAFTATTLKTQAVSAAVVILNTQFDLFNVKLASVKIAFALFRTGLAQTLVKLGATNALLLKLVSTLGVFSAVLAPIGVLLAGVAVAGFLKASKEIEIAGKNLLEFSEAANAASSSVLVVGQALNRLGQSVRTRQIFGEVVSKQELERLSAGVKILEDQVKDIEELRKEIREQIEALDKELSFLGTLARFGIGTKELKDQRAVLEQLNNNLVAAVGRAAQLRVPLNEALGEAQRLADAYEKVRKAEELTLAFSQTNAAARTAAVQEAVAQRVLSEEEGARRILEIDRKLLLDREELLEARIASLPLQQRQGQLSGSERLEKELELTKELAEVRQALARNQIDADRAEEERARARVENEIRRLETTEALKRASIQESVALRLLSEENAAFRLLEIENDTARDRLEILRRQMEELKEVEGISLEERKEREAAILLEAAQLREDIAQRETQRQEMVAKRKIQNINNELEAEKALAEFRLQALDARAQELDFLSRFNQLQQEGSQLQFEAQNELLGVRQQLLELVGTEQEIKRGLRDIERQSLSQLEAEQQFRREALEISQRQRDVDLQRQKIQAEIAVLEQQAQLERTRLERDVTPLQIETQERLLELRRRQLDLVLGQIAEQAALNEREKENLALRDKNEKTSLLIKQALDGVRTATEGADTAGRSLAEGIGLSAEQADKLRKALGGVSPEIDALIDRALALSRAFGRSLDAVRRIAGEVERGIAQTSQIQNPFAREAARLRVGQQFGATDALLSTGQFAKLEDALFALDAAASGNLFPLEALIGKEGVRALRGTAPAGGGGRGGLLRAGPAVSSLDLQLGKTAQQAFDAFFNQNASASAAILGGGLVRAAQAAADTLTDGAQTASSLVAASGKAAADTLAGGAQIASSLVAGSGKEAGQQAVDSAAIAGNLLVSGADAAAGKLAEGAAAVMQQKASGSRISVGKLPGQPKGMLDGVLRVGGMSLFSEAAFQARTSPNPELSIQTLKNMLSRAREGVRQDYLRGKRGKELSSVYSEQERLAIVQLAAFRDVYPDLVRMTNEEFWPIAYWLPGPIPPSRYSVRNEPAPGQMPRAGGEGQSTEARTTNVEVNIVNRPEPEADLRNALLELSRAGIVPRR